MTIAEIKQSIDIQKHGGHSSRVSVPITVLQELVAKAEAYDKIPQVSKEVWAR